MPNKRQVQEEETRQELDNHEPGKYTH